MSNRRQQDSYGVFVILISAFIGLIIILLAVLASLAVSAEKHYIVWICAALCQAGGQALLFFLTRRR